MTTRKSSTGLALLLSFLIAVPPVVLADDTELFTTSANPNVLLMLDTTGSMSSSAGGTSVGDLDGDGDDNTRMDILWRVVYTLLNADLSQPSYVTNDTVTVTCSLNNARRWSSPYAIESNIIAGRTYQYVEVNNCAVSPSSVSNDPWNLFPGSPTSGGTVRIGSGGLSENMTYARRSSGAPDRFTFSSAKSFSRRYNQGSLVSFSYSVSGSALYPENYPTNHTEAMSAGFLNNLTVGDDNTLLARLGLMTFTTNSTGTTNRIIIRNQISSAAPNAPPFTPSYRDIWSSVTDNVYASGGTPTAQALHDARTFFTTAYSSSQVCRTNYAVMITDGEDTKGGVSGAPTGNGYGPNYYCGGSFDPDGKSCGDQTGQVARHNAVIKEAANLLSNNPSVKLFTVGVGISDTDPDKNVQREVLRRAAEQTNAQATRTDYITIGGSGDDTSRGAGRAFFATDAEGLANALRIAFHQMSLGTYSFTAPTVASVRMTDRNYVYKASFVPAAPPSTFWNGNLQAGTINTDNTITWLWDADNVLKGTSPSSRRIYTSDNTWTRMDFDTSITPAMLAVDNTAMVDNVVNYVRGAGHDNNAKLGDIFHSKPVVVGPPSQFYFDEGYSTGGVNSFVSLKSQRKRVIYLGTNDGMLHAFLSGTYVNGSYDAGTGQEMFGYVPYNLLETLEDFLPGELTNHRYYVDSSPRVADIWIDANSNGTKETSEWSTVLISGLRKGGYSYFALDVTNPWPGSGIGTESTDYPKPMWEYTDSTYVGQTWSEPFIGKVKVTDGTTVRDRWVAIFGGGIGTGNVGRSLVVLDIATGRALKTFTSADGITNVIPASPTAVLDANGYIKFVYVADLAGSVYKFNLWNVATVSSFSVSPSSPPTVTGTQWTVNKIFQPASGGQPVYHRVEPAAVSETTRYLFFGTGNQESPISDGGTGKFYAVKDSDASTALVLESSLDNVTSNLGSGTVAPGNFGWYVNLAGVDNPAANTVDTNLHAMEKVLSDPVIFFNNVYFTTFTPNPSDPCNAGGIARVYGINMYNATAGLAYAAGYGQKPTGVKVGYYVYSGNPEGGIPSSPSLSIYPSGQSSIFVGFSTGAIKEIKIESPLHTKSIKSWKEIF